jgi:hypothetical protein
MASHLVVLVVLKGNPSALVLSNSDLQLAREWSPGKSSGLVDSVTVRRRRRRRGLCGVVLEFGSSIMTMMILRLGLRRWCPPLSLGLLAISVDFSQSAAE